MGVNAPSKHTSSPRRRRRLLTGGISVMFVVLALAAVVSAPAGAAGSVEARLDRVDGAGYAVIEVTISGFTPDSSVFVVPCTVPASGDPADVETDDCRVAAAEMLRADDDGAATRTIAWPIEDDQDAVAVAAGDDGQTELAVTILALRDPAVLGSVEPPPAQESPVGPPVAEAPAQEPEPDAAEPTALPETGDHSALIAAMGIVLVVGGAAAATWSRRLHRTTSVLAAAPVRRRR